MRSMTFISFDNNICNQRIGKIVRQEEPTNKKKSERSVEMTIYELNSLFFGINYYRSVNFKRASERASVTVLKSNINVEMVQFHV